MGKTAKNHALPSIHGSATVAASPALKPSPSFLVYPVPSIADESFLQLIFRGFVKRSLFWGFGRRRFAIAELADTAVAAKVETVIQQAAEDGQARSSLAGESCDTNALASTEGKRTERPNGSNSNGPDDDVAADSDQLDLADLLVLRFQQNLDGTPQGSTPETLANAATGEDSLSASSVDFSHLPFLFWRGMPVHVVVSGVRVADFYASGGAVPQHHAPLRSGDANEERTTKGKKKAAWGESGRRGDAAASEAMAERSSVVPDKRSSGSFEVDGRGTDSTAVFVQADSPAATKASFPKNCCQKCGSPNHFTRHCSETDTSRTATDDRGGNGHGSPETATSASTPPRAQASSRSSFPKNCCQMCGSARHFTRHCDGSGSAEIPPDTAASPALANTENSSKPLQLDATEEGTSRPERRPRHEGLNNSHAQSATVPRNVPAAAPSMQRTSKDQCKHCGSEAHLSRHCPSKI